MLDSAKNDVLMTIQEVMKHLSKSEQKVAEYVLEHSDETMNLSIASLSKNADVSEPTVVRFCRKLDFNGYQDFKIALAKGSTYTDETLKIIHEEILETDSLEEISQKVVNSHTLALRQTVANINYEQLEQFVDMLCNAGQVKFFGLGGSGTVAIDVENKFLRTGINTEVCIDSHIQLMKTSLLAKKDVVVIFSNSGATKHFADIIEIAHKNGTKVVVITSFADSILGRVADLTFEIRAKEKSYKQEPSSARLAMFAIMDVVVTAIALRWQKKYIQNIHRTREALSLEKQKH